MPNQFFHIASLEFFSYNLYKVWGFRPSPYVISLIRISTHPMSDINLITSFSSCATSLESFFILSSNVFHLLSMYIVYYIFGDLSREISKKIGFCTHFLGAFFVGEIEKGLTVVSPLLENRLSNYIP